MLITCAAYTTFGQTLKTLKHFYGELSILKNDKIISIRVRSNFDSVAHKLISVRMNSRYFEMIM